MDILRQTKDFIFSQSIRFRSWSWVVISLTCGMNKWHFTILLGPSGWGKQRWFTYYKNWNKKEKSNGHTKAN